MKKTILFPAIISISILLLISCEEGLGSKLNPSCTCTLIACSPGMATINISFNNIENDTLTFVRTDAVFQKIDSFSTVLRPSLSGLIYRLNRQRFGLELDDELKDFNYLVVNSRVNQIDSISNITYKIDTIASVCNECSGGPDCRDEYFQNRKYSNPSLKINQSTINALDVLISYQ